MKKTKRRNEGALKRRAEKRNCRASLRRKKLDSINMMPFKQYVEREQKVRERMGRKGEA